MADDHVYLTACFVEDPETGEVLAVEHSREYAHLIRSMSPLRLNFDAADGVALIRQLRFRCVHTRAE